MKEFPPEDGIQQIQLDSWRDFLGRDLLHRFAVAPAYIYRGQANCKWPIVSTLVLQRPFRWTTAWQFGDTNSGAPQAPQRSLAVTAR